MTLLLVLLLLSYLLSAIYSGSETALVSVDRIRLQDRLKRGEKRALIVRGLLDDPERTLGVTLVGTNLANVTCTAVATRLAIDWFGESGPTIATLILTPIVLIGAEILPKAIAFQRPLRSSLLLGRFIRGSYWVFYPFVHVALATARLLRGKGDSVSGDVGLSRDEVYGLLRDSHEGGVLAAEEMIMAGRIRDFRQSRVGEIMLPRSEMVVMKDSQTVSDARQVIARTGYSRIPVTAGDGSEVRGVLVASDLLGQSLRTRLGRLVRPILSLRPDAYLHEALAAMRETQGHLALVQSAEGLIGMVTLEDVLEEIVGEIEDEHDTDPIAHD